MTDLLSNTLSILALCISAVTAWLTFFRRGTVKMTQPTTIFFGPEPIGKKMPPKVFLRTLLFATSQRGRIIENMYISVARNKTVKNFNIWVYGERKQLVRGSGLFVGATGVEANHHFLTQKDDDSFRFTSGEYLIEVFAHLLGDKKRILLFSQSLEITKDMEHKLLAAPIAGIYFDWEPDLVKYSSHIDKHLSKQEVQETSGDQL